MVSKRLVGFTIFLYLVFKDAFIIVSRVTKTPYTYNVQIYLLPPPARADCLKNSVFQIHGTGPGPIAKPTI